MPMLRPGWHQDHLASFDDFFLIFREFAQCALESIKLTFMAYEIEVSFYFFFSCRKKGKKEIPPMGWKLECL